MNSNKKIHKVKVVMIQICNFPNLTKNIVVVNKKLTIINN